MKEDYFNIIDTKDKAYWLGFLTAEAYMETRNQKPYRLGIEIGKIDEILIDRFMKTLNLNSNYKYYRERDNTVIVKFVNNSIIKNLVKLGIVPRKSKIIQLPNLNKRELYLAFLHGFYDGDGKTGTTRIVSGSRTFLEQIKKYFNLPSKIYEKKNQNYWRGRLIKSHGYSMGLGVRLFREMLKNYTHSLPRKRHLLTKQEIKNKIKNSQDYIKKRKIKFTKIELESLVWKMPLSSIAAKYQVTPHTIKYWCIKWGIKTPRRDYWNKKRSTQKEKSKSEENENDKEDEEQQKETEEIVYNEGYKKTNKGEKEELEESTKKNQISEDSKEKNEEIIRENKQEHPYDHRFNKVEEEEDFSDPYLWISPKIREGVDENKEKLLEKVRERNVRYDDSLSANESLNNFEGEDLGKDFKPNFIKESSRENLFENQPLINPEIEFEPINNAWRQEEPLPDMGNNLVSERTIEPPIDKPPEESPEKPVDEPPEEPPEKPVDEPPEEPPEKSVDDPPEIPPEKPIDEPPEEPPEKPIDEPPEEPPEKPADEPPEIPPEKPIDNPPEMPPEKPIDEPPEEPPEKPIDEPPEVPPEKPIDEPPEEPPEKPIDEPPEEPPEKSADDPPEKPPEKPADEPPEVPPEKPIDEPPEEPPEKSADDPPEKPPEKPADEPPEVPPEKPIDDPPEEPPEKPDEGYNEQSIEEIIGSLPDITVMHSSFQSSNVEEQNQDDFTDSNNAIDKVNNSNCSTYEFIFNDDIASGFYDKSSERDILDDDIEHIDEKHDEWNNDFVDENEESVVEFTENQEESNDSNNIKDDPNDNVDIGESCPESETDSSYGYSDCPDDYPGE